MNSTPSSGSCIFNTQSVVTAASVLGTLAVVGAFAVKARSSQIFAPSVWIGKGDRRSVALTFDDGPSPGTMDLLEYFSQQGVRATFFQCGANIQRHPDIALAVHRAGHEIGNHTFSHSSLCPRFGLQPNLRSSKEIFQEFSQTQTILHQLGVEPRLLRAPYGLRWFGMREAQRKLRLLGVMWTVIGHDWEWGADEVTGLVLKKVRPGAIVCLHDGRATQPNPDIGVTLAAVKRLVPALRQAGYAFESVSDILCPINSANQLP